MENLKSLAIRVRNYKCFGGDGAGFERLLPVNLIVGRNNTGKSSLLDLVNYAVSPGSITLVGREGNEPEVLLARPLTEREVEAGFNKQTSGGIIGGNHWTFGKGWVNQRLTWRLEKNGKHTFVSIEPPSPLHTIDEHFQKIAKAAVNPLRQKIFRRLSSDRDIVPEGDGALLEITSNGSGATTAIRFYLTKASLPSELVEVHLLNDLKRILHPDSTINNILVQQIDDGRWEVYLEEPEKGRIPLSQSGSGLKTVLLTLTYLHLLPAIDKRPMSDYIFAFEELENNAHPALQRRLLQHLRSVAEKEGATFLLTTHSSVVIDLFGNDPLAQIIHVAHDGKVASTTIPRAFVDNQRILNDLDVRASDLLQANGLLWVEGPSDRIYLNRWIELWTGQKLREGIHYQCVFYGGRLLAHLTAEPESEEIKQLIDVLKVNRNLIFLLDSDRSHAEDSINPTKRRVQSEIEGIGGLVWVTSGREIENCLPREALEQYYQIPSLPDVGQYESFPDYLNRIKEGEGARFERNKPLFAARISSFLRKEYIESNAELGERISEVCRRIASWNRFPPDEADAKTQMSARG